MVIFDFGITGNKRSGRKSSAQTPAPKKDRVKGSKKNPKGSASKPNKQISFSPRTTAQIREIIKGTGIPMSVAKSVVRRGFGAYSSTHRPNISRQAWGLARLKTFVKKYQGGSVKKSYTQDDDLMREI